jgi:GAF domain/PucR C-terminal helix-turn-helix domain/GGDEF-like domain
MTSTRERELVDEARSRERELLSLYASARDLTALGEPDEVFAAVVQRAHELTGTDVAYLSVFDDQRGDLWVRATAGSVSEAFQRIHVPPGVGLAARVAHTRVPQWVSKYFDPASDLPHDRQIDRAVADEGLVSLLGVPLLVGDSVIGVLFAGSRVEKSFTPREVALLSAFADHAAVALHNARLYQQRRQALEDLQQAYRTIETHVQDIQAAQAVHEALTAVVLRGGRADELAEVVADALHGHVAILDRADQVVAVAGSPCDRIVVDGFPLRLHDGIDAGRDEGRQLRQAAAVSQQTGHGVPLDLAGSDRVTLVAITAGGNDLGTLLLAHENDLAPLATRTLERAGQILALLTLNQSALVEAEERVRGELLTELLNTRGSAGRELQVRARSRGINLTAPMVLVVVDSGGRPAEVIRRLNALPAPSAGIAGEYSGRPTLVVNDDNPAMVADQVHRYLRAQLRIPARVCAAGPLGSADTLGQSWSRAAQSCRLLLNLGVEDRAVTTDDLTMYTVLFDPNRADDLERFLGDTLQGLLDHDGRRGTALVDTLLEYFRQRANLARTARALNVHINTLLKRLERVSEILGEDWQNPDNALRLQVALQLAALRQGPGQHPH